MYSLSFRLPGLPRMTNPSGRKSHWAVLKKEKDTWKKAVWFAVSAKKPTQPLKRAKIHLIRCSSKAPDFDGLVSGFKVIIDALVLSAVLEGDTMEHLPDPQYLWYPADRGKGEIVVTLHELSDL